MQQPDLQRILDQAEIESSLDRISPLLERRFNITVEQFTAASYPQVQHATQMLVAKLAEIPEAEHFEHIRAYLTAQFARGLVAGDMLSAAGA